MEKSKPPRLDLTVTADDLVVTVDGEEYRPHAGEMVRLCGPRPGWWFLEALARLQASDGTVTSELLEALAGVVCEWDWTDDEGQPLPPPSADVLRRLSIPEVMWLAQTYMTGSEAARKNA